MKTLFAVVTLILVTIIFENPHQLSHSESSVTTYVDSVTTFHVEDTLKQPRFKLIIDSLSDIHKQNEILLKKLKRIKRQKINSENL